MARRFAKQHLPHLHSTRDTRDRLDLVTDAVPVGAMAIRADRIRYHPGDTAAAHYHADCHHAFYVLEGHGTLHVDGLDEQLSEGMVAIVEPNEVHWFSNESDADFSFVELWVPAPTRTVWVKPDDI